MGKESPRIRFRKVSPREIPNLKRRTGKLCEAKFGALNEGEKLGGWEDLATKSGGLVYFLGGHPPQTEGARWGSECGFLTPKPKHRVRMYDLRRLSDVGFGETNAEEIETGGVMTCEREKKIPYTKEGGPSERRSSYGTEKRTQ